MEEEVEEQHETLLLHQLMLDMNACYDPGEVLPSTRFPSVRLKPLGHPSNFEAKLIVRSYYIKQMNSIYLPSWQFNFLAKIIKSVLQSN